MTRWMFAVVTLCASLYTVSAWAAPPKVATLETLDYGSATLQKYKLRDFVPQVGHSRQLSSMSFSQDGAILVTASGLDDGMVKVWDTTRGHLLHTLKAEDYASVSPDGKTIATGNVGGPIELWSTETGKRLREIKGAGPVAFSPDGAYLVGESTEQGFEGALQVWEVAKDYAPGRKLEGHEGSLLGLSFSADGRFVASSSFDASAKVWDLKTFSLVRTYQREDHEVVAVALSPDAETLAISLRGEEKGIVLWDVSAQKVEKTLSGHAKSITGLAFSPDGKTLASSSLDNTTKLWDLASGAPKSVKGGGLVAFSPQQNLFAHGHHAVMLADASSLKTRHTFEANQALVFASAFTPDGGHLVTTNSTTTVDVWNTRNGVLEHTYKLSEPDKVELILSPTGRHVALRPQSGNKLVVHDIEKNKVAYTFEVPRATSIRSVSFGPGDTELVIEGTEGNSDATRLTWWNLKEGKALASTKLSGFVHVHGFIDGGDAVAMVSLGTRTSGSKLSLLFWDRESGLMKKVKVKDVAPYSGAVAFAPRGGSVALGDDDHTVKMLARSSKSIKGSMSGHGDLVNVASFSQDGSLLATGSWDKTLRLWDVTKGAQLLNVDDLLYKAQHISFSPDNKTLAVAHKGWVRLLHLPSGRTRKMYRFNTGGWLSFDTNGHFACDRKGCEAAFWRDQKGAWVGARDKRVKGLKGLKKLR